MAAPRRAGNTTVGQPRMSIGLQVGFVRPPAEAVRPDLGLSSRIAEMAGDRIGSPVTVSVSDGSATVRGSVKSSYDRAVIGAMVLMEPGIRQVQNELTVRPQTAPARGAASPAATD
jgi:osmotically-inducible protein OsmY